MALDLIVKSLGLRTSLSHPRVAIDIPIIGYEGQYLHISGKRQILLLRLAVEYGCFGFSLDYHVLCSYTEYVL